jgi:hypothetical protein
VHKPLGIPVQPAEPATLAARPVSSESAASGHLAQPVTIVSAPGDQQWSAQPVQNRGAAVCCSVKTPTSQYKYQVAPISRLAKSSERTQRISWRWYNAPKHLASVCTVSYDGTISRRVAMLVIRPATQDRWGSW